MIKKSLLVLLFSLLFPVSVLANSGVEYNLPYPGVLPDSPLYVLKVARDNVVSFFIRDPKQKAFYLLFLSDKRLAAGEILVKNNKTDLGITTVKISQEYYTKAVDLAVKVKDLSLTEKLIVAGVKHNDVMVDLASPKLSEAISGNQKDKNRVLELLKVGKN
jgi:hypothetical protein